jgi:hypothetical protein
MTLEQKITCDGCGEDITCTNNINDCRMVLTIEAKSHNSNIRTLKYAQPPITADLHFCGLGCLQKWAIG